MIDHNLELAFCAALKADQQLAALGFFTGLDDETHKLPAITVVSRSESLAGSAEVFRCDVEIRVETHAHDTRPQDHVAIVGRVRGLLADRVTFLAALNVGDGVHVLGYAAAGSEQEVSDEKFLTTITLKVGCRVPAN